MNLLTVDEAVRLVRDGDAVWIGGSGAGHAVPQAFIDALASHFTAEGSPRGLTTVRVVGVGDFADRGMSQLALPGLHARTIGSNIGNEPRLGVMVRAGEIEAYSFPQGVLSALCREMAAGRPGLVTDVGLGTYVDPRQTGGRQNEATTEDLVQVVELAGREWLFFPTLPIDVAVIRASTADEDGNLTMEHEAVHSDSLALAMAAHNNGGIVIAQVGALAQRHSLRPRDVRIPGALVDYVYVDADQRQTYATEYSAYYAGLLRRPDPAPSTRRPRATSLSSPSTVMTSSSARTPWPSESPVSTPARPMALYRSSGSAELEFRAGWSPVGLNQPMMEISSAEANAPSESTPSAS